MKPDLGHYLVSMPMADGYLHSYVIAADRDVVLQVENHVADQLESTDIRVLPIYLETLLSHEAAKRVQAFIAANFPKSGKLLREVKDFHYTSWIMPAGSPDSDWLLALH